MATRGEALHLIAAHHPDAERFKVQSHDPLRNEARRLKSEEAAVGNKDKANYSNERYFSRAPRGDGRGID
ncbi:hypothetical protein [Agrobacterium tumefaciens]|nr:hypothetical protein [Agrobacterium tumefaciens]